MLTVLADGKKLPPYVILKWKNLPKNESFLPGLIVKAQEKGWLDNELLLEWIKRVWNQQPGALLKHPGMLVMDSFRGHLTDNVKKGLSKIKTQQVIIPGGMTSMLQPLDVCINKPFKCQLKKNVHPVDEYCTTRADTDRKTLKAITGADLQLDHQSMGQYTRRLNKEKFQKNWHFQRLGW